MTDNHLFAAINCWKNKLLDLSKRNRALHFRPNEVSTVTIVDEQPAEIFRLLCLKNRALKFLPSVGAQEAASEEQTSSADAVEEAFAAPDFAPYEPKSLADRYTDDYLQTSASAERLDRSLRRLDERARSIIEEQGVNALFLALGMLYYRESDRSPEFYKAPLLLVPVELSRRSARAGFTVKATEEEPLVNPTLSEYLRRTFGIALPELPTSGELDEDRDAQEFFAAVAEAVAEQKEWKIKNEIHLALFSFQKLAMYKDLERNAAALAAHPIIQKMVARHGEQFSGERFISLPEEIERLNLDQDFAPERTAQVLDADASQLRAIAAVARGYDLVLEGPPGTGKSQTITNLIAQALADGKSVLFVAEKRAALEVVHRRLVNVGLDEFCLELHSTKANKRAVMQEIGRALDASLQRAHVELYSGERLSAVRQKLNEYVSALHQPYGALNLSPYRVYGELGRVQNAPKVFLRADIFDLDRQRLADTLRDLRELAAAAGQIGPPTEHPWRDARKTFYAESELDKIQGLGAEMQQRLSEAMVLSERIKDELGLPAARNFTEAAAIEEIAEVMAASPGVPEGVLKTEEFDRLATEARALIESGRRTAAAGERAASLPLAQRALDEVLSAARTAIELGRRALELKRSIAAAAVLQHADSAFVEAQRLISTGRQLARLRRQLCAKFTSEVADQDPSDEIAYVERKAFGFFGFLAALDGRFRAIKRRWLALRLPTYRASLLEQANDMKTAARLWRERRELEAREELGRAIFGSLWQGEESNWNALEKVLLWAVSLRQLCAKIVASSACDGFDALAAQADEIEVLLTEYARRSRLPESLFLASWQRMRSDLEMVGAYLRARAQLRDLDHAGAAVGGPLWEGESSNWDALEKYVAWREACHRLCARHGLHDGSWKEAHAGGHEEAERLERELTEIEAASNRVSGSENPDGRGLAAWQQVKSELACIAAYLREKRHLEAQRARGALIFGERWRGEASDWPALEDCLAWAARFRSLSACHVLGERAVELASRGAPDVAVARSFAQRIGEVWSRLPQFCQLAGLASDYFDALDFATISGRLARLLDELHRAPEWAAFEMARQRVENGAAAELLPLAIEGEIAFDDLAAAFERAFYQKWLERVIPERPALLQFHSLAHEQRIAEFRRLDEQVLRENRTKLVNALRERVQFDLQRRELQPAMSFLRRQLARQRGLAPLRVTMKHALAAIRAIKPCFMMSPQTVAQLLESVEDKFDLVIFDEASQLPTEDAIGTILRGKQVVIVGDPRQLPPTNFFAVQNGTVEAEVDEDGLPRYEDMPSVLEEVAGAGLPSTRLRWHYRSAHESLITFSNVRFYNADLCTFPSVETDPADAGVRFEFVADGLYEGQGLNLIEARRVVDAVVEHAKKHPDLSLGVGTFGLRQQIAIQDEIEQRRRHDPELESFFDRNRDEPFFVKNLENIQGDERDVIFLSVTYARGRDGLLRYRFGPLNGENGWRRLNVLATRARKLMRVFSSIRSDDINVAATTSRGAHLLHAFLLYAERRRLDAPTLSARGGAESAFEQDVLRELTARGIDLVPRVGESGNSIDFGVLDGEVPGRFICGIECDGPTYGSAQTARDRDRLRQQVLETRGWEIHRVWSTDWFKNRAQQIERLLASIEASRQRLKLEEEERQPRIEAVPPRRTPLRAPSDEFGDGSVALVQNAPRVARCTDGHARLMVETYRVAPPPDATLPRSPLETPEELLASLVQHVVNIESPIHLDEAAARVASFFGVKFGSRIKARITETIRRMRRQQLVEVRGEFVYKPGSVIRPRVRSGTRVSAELIAPEEIEQAVILILQTMPELAQDELVNEVRALFGADRTGPIWRQQIARAIRSLLKRGVIGFNHFGLALRA